MLESWHIVTTSIPLSFLYTISIVIYRLYFHPLVHFPGPWLAKTTYLYEWYYDIYLPGQFTFKLKDLHKRYGPIIRINPDEVHINDPDFFDELYSQRNGRAVKPRRTAEAFGPYSSTLATQSHELHRIRRSAINPFFSKKSVVDLVPVIRRPIDMLCERLKEVSRDGGTVNLKYMFAAVTLDIIKDHCFAREPESVLKSDFGRKGFDDVNGFIAVSLWNTHMPWIMRLTYSLPDSVKKILSPTMADVLAFRLDLSRQVEAIRHGHDKSYEKVYHRTVFHELLESKLPANELKRDRLRDEAFSLITAGSGTTAYVLLGTAYHVAANPAVRQRLYDELRAVIPDPSDLPTLAELERLPYLTVIIQEGLRLCGPVTHCILRQYPDKAISYQGYVIPADTTVGMTGVLIHQNEKIYPSPHLFQPERWLADGKRLERYLVPFSRGSRACLGINLARAKLYLILAVVFRQFDFDVSRVNRERDIDWSRDYLLGAQARDSPGIRVQVKHAV
ncbi:cytochrome P450 [Aspergillus ibericus CBS 121593]|uniref:Putative benzoate 4-monooxygenase cytochrome P450 n=1 Tax=Aspergillus ibericus CBS 121593 TaxID=1448316 RepID=A0A395GUN5_9EURO|nr:putative benzoate 4-monooxygenase cytochrome P450 [Aspergillus ibericus CBS 121593]RAK99186.1 putative benzoate 4-monooxygenase cytochrome P450 [Aspergillus ibericus CBS 121593]